MLTDQQEHLTSAREVIQSQRCFLRRHHAVIFLRWWAENDGKENAIFFHHLAKRVGQGQAEVETKELHVDCQRLTVTYKGNTHSWRIPTTQ